MHLRQAGVSRAAWAVGWAPCGRTVHTRQGPSQPRLLPCSLSMLTAAVMTIVWRSMVSQWRPRAASRLSG